MSKFLIGAATAAHQVEGNNIFSDCWAMEQMKNSSFAEPSGIACDHYNRYEEDIALLKNAGLNAYRFSIEWARIEPREGEFDETEVKHYEEVLKCCKRNNVEPIVTLFHFSSPKWLISKGGWESEGTPYYFARYCKHVVEKLGGLMSYVCTINEANMGVQIASLAKSIQGESLQIGLNLDELKSKAELTARENLSVFGVANPQVFLSARTDSGDKIVMEAHKQAKQAIKSVNNKIKIGLTLSLHDMQGECAEAEKEWDEEFLHYLPYIKDDDFIGVQNYTRTVFGKSNDNLPKTQMGYEIYPEALEHVIRRVYAQSKLPVFVTENGIAIEDDGVRCAFIDKALYGVKSCLKDGISVLGYCHWSLLDNFEWQKGYGMKFGLIAVDRTTQKRYPKESLYRLGKYRTAL